MNKRFILAGGGALFIFLFSQCVTIGSSLQPITSSPQEYGAPSEVLDSNNQQTIDNTDILNNPGL